MTGTIPDGLSRYLASQFGRPVQISNLEPLSAGARRHNLAFDAAVGVHTLRLVATIVPSSIELVPVGAEVAVRALAGAHGVPVPDVVATCTDSSYVGSPFVLSERIDGETVPRKVLRLVRSEGIGERVAQQLGEAMGHLHGIDPELAPPQLPGDADGDPAENLVAEVEDGVGALLADRPVFALALRWLHDRLPERPRHRAVLHTDMRNGNLIVGPDGIRAVLDWEGARRFGDPMADAGWSALRMWRFREDDREFGGFAARAPFVEGYEHAGGQFDIERFRWWKVASTFRWGVGLAAQAAAHLDGRVPNIVMAASGRRIPEIEWDLLMQIRPCIVA
jgi:aminoglycoside phosphotransferase (APT) family kinase protein